MTQKTTDQILLDAIQGLRDDIARIDRDLGNDRKAIEGMAMEFTIVKERLDQFSKQLDTQQNKLQDKVADAVAPMMETAENLTTAIDNAKVVKIKENKKPFWKIW